MSAVRDASTSLKRLSEAAQRIADPLQDIRGRQVRDAVGEKLGKVKDLLIHETDRLARFIEVEWNGFLGIGTSRLLLPVELVRTLTTTAVVIGHEAEDIDAAPEYDPIRLNEDFLRKTYSYYGCTPYWQTGYTYPQGWFT